MAETKKKEISYRIGLNQKMQLSSVNWFLVLFSDVIFVVLVTLVLYNKENSLITELSTSTKSC